MFAMTCGLPASGKSTWCKEHFKHIISPDDIRYALYDYDSGLILKFEEIVWTSVKKSIQIHVDLGHDFILDATNLIKGLREDLLSDFDAKKVCYVFDTPLKECLRRNDRRIRKVPEHVMTRMNDTKEPPGNEFDRIMSVI